MNRALYFSLATLLVGSAATAAAQTTTDPDIRNIRPIVMLLVDTSGSMERLPGGSDAALPMCSGSTAGVNQRNRWHQTVEALTGTWSDTNYYCRQVSRATLPAASPDYNYYLPYHTLPPITTQNNDGVLDVYLDRIKFGLMTFDATYTFSDAHPLLVPRTTFLGRLADNISLRGGYSYGDPRPLNFIGCGTTFMVDSGARNEGAPGGALIPVATTEAAVTATNQSIQNQLLSARPYGGTPTAALLHDFQYYLNNHASVTTDDPFAACRPTYAVLLTDGQPDEDFRDRRFDCDAGGTCPYGRAADYARDLCRYSSASGECSGDVDGVFVVAFDVSDSAALAELDNIANLGGTTAALRASDRAELMRRLSDILDRAAPGNTTRSRPAFVSSGSTYTTGGVPNQYEFHAGFRVGDEDTAWSGVLERARFLCSGLAPTPEPISSRVQYHEVLRTQAASGRCAGPDPCATTSGRLLYSVATPNASQMTGNILGDQATSVPLGAPLPSGTVSNRTLVPITSSTLSPAHFGIATGSPSARAARQRDILDWVYGTTSDRADNPLADIYHSSPVTVGPPRVDIADEAYNEFRRLPAVANRPTVAYVGSNDGILHAFVVEDFTDPVRGTRYTAGQELWGFVPPILVPKLESAATSHQIMLDGTPIVKDVFYRRLPGDAPNGNIYHTVLIMGFRAGAPGYFALDVTDPAHPVFLWQFVGDQTGRGGASRGRSTRGPTALGYAYGAPALGQVLVDIGGTLQERAIALLPGGVGEVDTSDPRSTGPIGCPAQGVGQPPVNSGTINARSRQRCWGRTGRVLTWVDVVTGEVIREFGADVFNAPLSGGVAIAPGDVGQVAERAFLTDADGVMWAVDFSSRRTSEWDVRPVHDIFWDSDATVGQPAYHPPVVSSDSQGQFVVVQATGDIDRLDAAESNRVVSFTEQVTYASGGRATYDTNVNWEVRLQPGEQVTGALEIFEGNVYFATFETNVSGTDACELGRSRIWAVDYLQNGATPPAGYSDVLGGRFPEGRFERTPGSGTYDMHFQPELVNELVLGVGITQRPTCVAGADEFDPYIGSRYRVGDVGGGSFVLTAQVSGGSADPATTGSIRTIEQTLPTPQSFTTVQSFSGQVDY
ncbi:MAG: PilC/PilY family type IV pilus protein [Sandaracinaceae bacterium]